MSAHEDDSSLTCGKCGQSYDIHEYVSPRCDGDTTPDPLMEMADVFRDAREQAIVECAKRVEEFYDLKERSKWKPNVQMNDGRDQLRWIANGVRALLFENSTCLHTLAQHEAMGWTCPYKAKDVLEVK